MSACVLCGHPVDGIDRLTENLDCTLARGSLRLLLSVPAQASFSLIGVFTPSLFPLVNVVWLALNVRVVIFFKNLARVIWQKVLMFRIQL